jgi:uncharacterized protein YjbI with pentapeptide repeats
VGGYVFLSYHRPEEEYVRRLAAYFRESEIEAWFDESIEFGAQWEMRLRDQIDRCAVFVVVMTPGGEESSWVRREIARARAGEKPILPLLLAGKPYFSLGDLHYHQVRGGALPQSGFVQQLRQILGLEMRAHTSVRALGDADPGQRQSLVDNLCERLRDQHSDAKTRAEAQDVLVDCLAPSGEEQSWDGLKVDLTDARLVDLELGACRVAEVDFSRAIFDGHTSFQDAEFTDAATFSDADFRGPVTFSKALFRRQARYRGVDFRDDMTFSFATFLDYTSFADATASGSARFTHADFSNGARFANTIFEGPVSFAHADFGEDVSFRGTEFNGEAQFFEVTFAAKAGFSASRFRREISFASARFKGDVTFFDARFLAVADFEDARFHRLADFMDARFSTGALLAHADVSDCGLPHRWPDGWHTEPLDRNSARGRLVRR